MDTYYLHTCPYLRLLLFWAAGVWCADACFGWLAHGGLWVPVFLLLAVVSVACSFLRRYALRWCFGASVGLFCFVGGWGLMTQELEAAACRFPQEKAVYRARLLERPVEKPRTYLCKVQLEELRDSAGTHPLRKKAYFYIAKDSMAQRLRAGDRLWAQARLALPQPGEGGVPFDYGRYLLRHGVSGTGYVAAGQWRHSSVESDPTWRMVADGYRERLIALYAQLGFAGDGLAVLSALTVGDQDEVSRPLLRSYSVSGASHVLSLSGLHIGLLYALLSFLLGWMDRWHFAGRCVRSLLILLLLGAFAFFTGLAPTVVRSVCMFSVLALALLFSRQALSMNTLLGVAWWMLLFHPAWLFDVGFQLSFLAVAAILLFCPWLYRRWRCRTWLGKQVWGLCCVSVAAQAGTAPLVAYYFGNFPTHFLLTNFVVVPLTTLILYVAVAMLLLTPWAAAQAVAGEACRAMVELLNRFVGAVERLPYAMTDCLWLFRWEVAALYAALALWVAIRLYGRLRGLPGKNGWLAQP